MYGKANYLLKAMKGDMELTQALLNRVLRGKVLALKNPPNKRSPTTN